VQLHHIDSNPQHNVFDNLAVLCLECHHETLLSGGFARHLTPELVRRYRDTWVTLVAEKRQQWRLLAGTDLRLGAAQPEIRDVMALSQRWSPSSLPWSPSLLAYLLHLLVILERLISSLEGRARSP
jgi:hypothetical protein